MRLAVSHSVQPQLLKKLHVFVGIISAAKTPADIWDIFFGTLKLLPKRITVQVEFDFFHMGVSKNNGTPKSSILIGFSIINHPLWGTPIFENIHMGIRLVVLFVVFAHLLVDAGHNGGSAIQSDDVQQPDRWDRPLVQVETKNLRTKELKNENVLTPSNLLWISDPTLWGVQIVWIKTVSFFLSLEIGVRKKAKDVNWAVSRRPLYLRLIVHFSCKKLNHCNIYSIYYIQCTLYYIYIYIIYILYMYCSIDKYTCTYKFIIPHFSIWIYDLLWRLTKVHGVCNEFHGAGKLRNDFMNRERVSMVILLVQQLEVIIEVSIFRNICVHIYR